MKNALLHFSFFAFRFSFFIFILLQSYSLTVLSQEQPHDYQLFRQDATYFYHKKSFPDVVAVRLDSSVITADGTEWYNHESLFEEYILPQGDWCNQPDGPSWIGYKLQVKSNGDNLLYGINDDFNMVFFDTLIIKTMAMPGDTWCYCKTGTLVIGPDTMASVTRHDTMTFMGITDSIKVINLGLDSMILSKQYGLVRALNFKDFCPYSYYDEYELAGITTPDTVIGPHLLTAGDIYDYEVGDVFHRRSDFSDWPYATLFDVYEVLDKSFSSDQDTVFYLMGRIEWFEGPEGTSMPEYDTILETYSDLDEILFDGHFPTETIWGDSSFFYSYELMYHEQIKNGRLIYQGPFVIYYGWTIPDSCYEAMASNSTVYIEDCGSYLQIFNDNHYCWPCQELEYYKKSGEEWGNPYAIPTGINEIDALNVKIYPNPAGDYVMIDLDRKDIDGNLTITLSDLSGRKLENKIIEPVELPCRLDVRSLNSGIYFLKIRSGERSTVRKIIL